MNCDHVRDLLALVDPDARVERQALLDHLLSCEACGVDHADALFMLRAAPHAALPARRRAIAIGPALLRIVAAALLLIATGALLVVEPRPDHGETLVRAPVEEPGHIRVLPAGVLTTTQTTLKLHPDRATVARLERRTWTPNDRRVTR